MKSLQSRLFLSAIERRRSASALGRRWVPVLLFYFQAQLSRCFIPAEQVDCLLLPLTPWGPAAATASCTQLAHPLPAELGNHA